MVKPLVVCALALGISSGWARDTRFLNLSMVHRGDGVLVPGRVNRPDNSLEACLYAWSCDVVPEADIRRTKDGVIVAYHNATYKRRKIEEYDWAELRDVSIGAAHGPEWDHVRIPLWEGLFAAMKGRPERLLYVDEKGAPPKVIAELAERFGVIEQTYYCSPNWRLIPQWRKIAPKGRSMVWLGAWPKDNSPEETARAEAFVQQRLDEMAATGFDGIDQVQIHVRTDLSKEDPFCPSTPFLRRAVELLHSHGVSAQVVTWTEGTNKDVHRRLWALGFDHFTTDYPEVFFELAEEFKRSAD